MTVREYASLSPSQAEHREVVVAKVKEQLIATVSQGSLFVPVTFGVTGFSWNKGFFDYEYGAGISERHPGYVFVKDSMARSAMLHAAMAGAHPETLEQVKDKDEYDMPITLTNEVGYTLEWASGEDRGFDIDVLNGGEELPERSLYWAGGWVLKRNQGIEEMLRQAYDVGVMARKWVVSDGKFKEKLDIREAVSDTYWRIVSTDDYESGDEKIFFEDAFKAALQEVKQYTGWELVEEQIDALRNEIRTESGEVERYGFDEPLIHV